MESVRRIVQLEESVINRIAAGEVVVRPANALKELIENCLDAGSRSVAIMVKAGGLKMLRIEDDGHGIRSEDLPILCERFTTSKLQKYEDLQGIGTFGFRGEALASISHVAQITVTTMTESSQVASMAQYSEGHLVGPVRPCAGTKGTTIVVENMFYNNPTRKQALKESLEHSKVLEVVQRYAIHHPSVAFSCRKASGAAELATAGSSPSAREVIGTIWGQGLAKELFPFEVKSEEPRFSCRGFASGPNYSSRSSTLILFINNRLVECAPLKRAVEAVYQPVLPRHQHPWVYLALDVDPQCIDVNVHPTKMEVQFLHEETISLRLQEALAGQLRSLGTSRNFAAALPSLIDTKGRASSTPAFATPPASVPAAPSAQLVPAAPPATPAAPTAAPTATASAPPPKRVRTDHRQLSLQSMLSQAPSQPLASQVPAFGATQSPPTQAAPASASQVVQMSETEREARMAAYQEAQELTSVEELRKAVEADCDEQLSKLLNQSVFVGPVNHELVLLQCGASLCLANMAILAREYAYQRLLRLIGGMGSIQLSEGLPLKDLLRMGLEDPEAAAALSDKPCAQLLERFEALLLEKAELLKEYFMLEIQEAEDGPRVKSVPNGLGLSSDSGCCFDGLPLFLVRLCSEVNWQEEKACLDGICRVSADFSADLLLPSEEQAEAAQLRKANTEALNAAVQRGEFEDVVAAAKRPRTCPLQGLRWLHEVTRKEGSSWPRDFAKNGTLLDLVSLDQLYKIFERCCLTGAPSNEESQLDFLVPMFPHYASGTTGSCLAGAYRTAAELYCTPFLSVLPPFYGHRLYVSAMEKRILASIGEKGKNVDHTLFSFHGVPEEQCSRTDITGSYCNKGAGCCAVLKKENRNCYRAQCFETARLLASSLGLEEGSWSIGFQSRLTLRGTIEWIKPYTDEAFVDLAKRGVRKLAIVAPSFTADCVETLEELGITGREEFEEAGGEELVVIPCLNSSTDWVKSLAHIVTEHIAETVPAL
ncbi:unnamed protein product [Effrenium voratum]|uniref:DNA mismatch repair protein S5 domain-containing protein n=1 Tax=Effrenium voratum TaxID=2562239 RepID=A0AA36MPP1_9DINO|nr:unnamed protein product [Effrenium voratum]